MRVLHLPTAVGGNAWGLAQGERGLGIDSDVLVASQGGIRYPAHNNLDLQDEPSALRRFAARASTFFKIRRKYDVFHFNYGTSLLHREGFPLLDVPFYPARSKLFVTYNGCDARQKFPTMKRASLAACHNINCYNGVCNSGEQDDLRRRCINKMARYVDHMWAVNPDLLYFLPPEKSSFLPYTVSNPDQEVIAPDFGKRKLKFLHAPTSREAKGSAYILRAMENLLNRYPDQVELVVVEGLSHEEAMRRYREADVIIDQILVGWYGAFAVETMLMGKPVVVRIAKEDLHFIPKEMANHLLETVICAEPRSIEEQLARCIEDRQWLRDRSQASIAYARKWHDPLYVAGLTKELYEA